MRRVLLQRPAFLDNALCERGSIVPITDGIALASYMTLQADAGAPVAADKTVTVHVHHATGEIDIDANGVEIRVDGATLKVERD